MSYRPAVPEKYAYLLPPPLPAPLGESIDKVILACGAPQSSAIYFSLRAYLYARQTFAGKFLAANSFDRHAALDAVLDVIHLFDVFERTLLHKCSSKLQFTFVWYTKSLDGEQRPAETLVSKELLFERAMLSMVHICLLQNISKTSSQLLLAERLIDRLCARVIDVRAPGGSWILSKHYVENYLRSLVVAQRTALQAQQWMVKDDVASWLCVAASLWRSSRALHTASRSGESGAAKLLALCTLRHGGALFALARAFERQHDEKSACADFQVGGGGGEERYSWLVEALVVARAANILLRATSEPLTKFIGRVSEHLVSIFDCFIAPHELLVSSPRTSSAWRKVSLVLDSERTTRVVCDHAPHRGKIVCFDGKRRFVFS